MTNSIVWYIGDEKKQFSIRRLSSNECVEQPSQLHIARQPMPAEPLRLRDRTQVRADTERRALELELRRTIAERLVDKFREGYLCCMVLLS